MSDSDSILLSGSIARCFCGCDLPADGRCYACENPFSSEECQFDGFCTLCAGEPGSGCKQCSALRAQLTAEFQELYKIRCQRAFTAAERERVQALMGKIHNDEAANATLNCMLEFA
jgi:hypothetical protein